MAGNQGYVWQMNPDYVNNVQGRKFKNVYDIKEELGKGGFGTVRRCVIRAQGGQRREFAVKMNNTPDKRTAQEHEADICRGAAAHPPANRHLVNIFDSITEGDIVYNMFELAFGGDLMADITKREFFDEDDAANAIVQILRGVNHLHGSGAIHLDLKPHNILVESKDTKIYKVTDFGLAQRRHGAPNYVAYGYGKIGTAGYQPPEAIRGMPYDTDFDIWACGVILYQMLAGYTPFWEDDTNVQNTRVNNVEYDFPSPEWDGMTDAQNMIRRMIAPNDHYNPPAAVPNFPAQPRLTFVQLQPLPFFQRGAALVEQNLQQIVVTNPMDRYNARKVLKQTILMTHWTSNAGAQAAAQVMAQPPQQAGPPIGGPPQPPPPPFRGPTPGGSRGPAPPTPHPPPPHQLFPGGPGGSGTPLRPPGAPPQGP